MIYLGGPTGTGFDTHIPPAALDLTGSRTAIYRSAGPG
jgi:hypothetical protein